MSHFFWGDSDACCLIRPPGTAKPDIVGCCRGRKLAAGSSGKDHVQRTISLMTNDGRLHGKSKTSFEACSFCSAPLPRHLVVIHSNMNKEVPRALCSQFRSDLNQTAMDSCRNLL